MSKCSFTLSCQQMCNFHVPLSCWHCLKNRFHTQWHHSLKKSFLFYSEGRTRKSSVTLTLLHFHYIWNIQTRSQIKSFQFFSYLLAPLACTFSWEIFSYHSCWFFFMNFLWPKTETWAWIVNVRNCALEEEIRHGFMHWNVLPQWLIAGCLDAHLWARHPLISWR